VVLAAGRVSERIETTVEGAIDTPTRESRHGARYRKEQGEDETRRGSSRLTQRQAHSFTLQSAIVMQRADS